MVQLPVPLDWLGSPPDPLAHSELYDGLLWRRVFAYFFDIMAIAVLIAAVWSGLVLLGLLSFGLLWVLLPAVGFIPIAYHALQVGGPHNATIGMRLFDLQVRSWDGARPDIWQGFLMGALFYATIASTCFLILLVALFNDRRRTVHDYLSGVVVVRHLRGTGFVFPPAQAA